ncbi:MAG: 7-carboxy-7-deazaguanine synthase QueE [Planctomycetia bacterium]|nr:7-carboxy-7-deazaguanine synthase QueE [Planctomycetia bacterium]
MRIAEIYSSLQGEGLLAGTPSVFVRTSGCNLRCAWCDTPFTSWAPEGDEIELPGVLAAVTALAPHHVVVTGGEPLLVADVADLCRRLRAAGRHVTIETAGTVWLDAPADLMSISPKLSSSGPPADTPGGWRARHEATRRDDAVLRRLVAAAPYQLKFVIDSPADIAETLAWIEDLERAGPPIDRGRVLLMPQGRTRAELAAKTAWLAGECARLGVGLARRRHIEWFGDVRGT